jgi:hypothetical protein
MVFIWFSYIVVSIVFKVLWAGMRVRHSAALCSTCCPVFRLQGLVCTSKPEVLLPCCCTCWHWHLARFFKAHTSPMLQGFCFYLFCEHCFCALPAACLDPEEWPVQWFTNTVICSAIAQAQLQRLGCKVAFSWSFLRSLILRAQVVFWIFCCSCVLDTATRGHRTYLAHAARSTLTTMYHP